MSEIFKALNNFTPRERKRHYVIIDGKRCEVTLEKKLEVMRQGEHNFILVDSQIKLKPTSKPKARYSTLTRSQKGYSFEKKDIHWPKEIVDGGFAWLTEYE